MLLEIRTRNPTINALFFALRESLGCDQPFPVPQELNLSRASPERFVRSASAHSILNIISRTTSPDNTDLRSLLKGDLLAFLKYMRENNAARNKEIKKQLLEASDALQRAGLKVVALKGAIELIDPMYSDIADRFLGDLDLLVEPQQIDDGISALTNLGYYPVDATDAHMHYRHAPPMLHEAWPTAIELHRSVSQDVRGKIIVPSSRMMKDALPSGEIGLYIPALVDRISHLVVHAQLDSHRYSSHWILLRDVADIYRLSRLAEPDTWADVRCRFAEASANEMLDSFMIAAEHVLGYPLHSWETDRESKEWAEHTLRLLAWPEIHKLSYVKSLLKYHTRNFISTPSSRSTYVKKLLSASHVKKAFQLHRMYFRGYQ